MIDALITVAVLLFLFVPSVINWLKGKRLWGVLGFPTGWHWIPVFRLAKPDSWWAKRFYAEDKLRLARGRFQSPTPADAATFRDVDAIEELTAEEIVFHDKTTRKAWEKARREGRLVES